MFKRASGGPSKADAGKQPVSRSPRPAKVSADSSASANATAAAKAQAAGKLAYESRRAAKAGVSLDRWMADKQKRVQAELEAERRARAKALPAAKPGFLKRLLDRAHKPL